MITAGTRYLCLDSHLRTAAGYALAWRLATAKQLHGSRLDASLRHMPRRCEGQIIPYLLIIGCSKYGSTYLLCPGRLVLVRTLHLGAVYTHNREKNS